ncbi:LacI family DNA-binding transcriptional regulator [Agilicoccus flavus]|uniref:LacI family DNA-binding transcriptional regulator n=1 Tax=Agilicoccus flavus TaxID=2775968 RepID=UPI001CF6A3BC|nr:LacI family DNA-binding transcriptional regulator [Agilicoccus flavus]
MVTSHDVARLAGVSQPTVSRALRGDARVSAATRAKVERAVAELGYVPSATGRALSMGRSYRVGLLVTDLENQFYPHLIAPVHDTLGHLGYELILMTDHHDRGPVTSRIRALGLDGVILATSSTDSPVPVRLRDQGIPFVYFNRVGDAVDADRVTSDPVPGVSAMVDRLAEEGHTRIGAIFGPTNASTGLARAAALRRALASHGLAVHPSLEVTGPFEAITGREGLRVLWEAPVKPTAVVCANDVVALGAFNGAADMGLDIPGDVSILGFDDLPEASWPVFDLSTVAFDLRGMASTAATLLARRIGDPGAPVEHHSFPTRFVERGSLAPPRTT